MDINKIERLLMEVIRVAVTLLLLLLIMYALIPSAHAETTYYILGDRNVVRTFSPDPVGEDRIVYVDCQKRQSTNDDVIGCIIAANYYKESLKLKRASEKTARERYLAKH